MAKCLQSNAFMTATIPGAISFSGGTSLTNVLYVLLSDRRGEAAKGDIYKNEQNTGPEVHMQSQNTEVYIEYNTVFLGEYSEDH